MDGLKFKQQSKTRTIVQNDESILKSNLKQFLPSPFEALDDGVFKFETWEVDEVEEDVTDSLTVNVVDGLQTVLED